MEFTQNKIWEINSKYNVDMFPTTARGRKAFPAEQKIRQLKKKIFRLKFLEKGEIILFTLNYRI